MSEEIKEDNKVDTTKSTAELLTALKKKADLLGITYNAKIGLEKLKLKIELFMEEKGGNEPINEKSVGPSKSVHDIEAAAKKPMLVVVNDLDATQLNDPTIITNIGNKYFKIGCITEKGKEQLVPKAVIDSLRAKTMVQWVDEKHSITKRPTGNRVARTTKRYNINVIDANPKVN